MGNPKVDMDNSWYNRQLAKIDLADNYIQNYGQTFETVYHDICRGCKQEEYIHTLDFWNDFIHAIEDIYTNIKTYFENPEEFVITKGCIQNLDYSSGKYMIEDINIQLLLLEESIVGFINSKCNLINDVVDFTRNKNPTMRDVYVYFKYQSIPDSAGSYIESEELIMKKTLQHIFNKAMCLRQQTLLWMLVLSDELKHDHSNCGQFLSSIPFEFILAYISMRQDNDASGGVLSGYVPYSNFLANEYILYNEDKTAYTMKPISTVHYLLRTDPEVSSQHFTNLASVYNGRRGTLHNCLKNKINVRSIYGEKLPQSIRFKTIEKPESTSRCKSWRVEKPSRVERTPKHHVAIRALDKLNDSGYYKSSVSSIPFRGSSTRDTSRSHIPPPKQVIEKSSVEEHKEEVPKKSISPSSVEPKPVKYNYSSNTVSVSKDTNLAKISPQHPISTKNFDNIQPKHEKPVSKPVEFLTSSTKLQENDENKPLQELKKPVATKNTYELVKPLSYREIILKYSRVPDTENFHVTSDALNKKNYTTDSPKSGNSVIKKLDTTDKPTQVTPLSPESPTEEQKTRFNEIPPSQPKATVHESPKSLFRSSFASKNKSTNKYSRQTKLVRFHDKSITIPY